MLGQGLHWLKDISLFVLAKAYHLNLLVYVWEEQYTNWCKIEFQTYSNHPPCCGISPKYSRRQTGLNVKIMAVPNDIQKVGL